MEERKFVEHLEELRIRLIKSLAGIAVGVVISFFFVSVLFKFLTRPYFNYLTSAGVSASLVLRSLSPADAFQISIHSALILGLAISLPWLAYQIWSFISPGLYKNEKKYVIPFCLAILSLFLIGGAFAYFAVLPVAITFFYQYTVGMGIAPDWTVANYFRFVVTFLVCFGIVFEMPVAVVILAKLGLVTPQSLSQYRRHAIVIIFIVAAIFTPPDVISQLMMGMPMVLLYEVSILASRFFIRTKTIDIQCTNEYKQYH